MPEAKQQQTTPILSHEVVATAVTKTQAFLKSPAFNPGNIHVEANNFFGQLQLVVSIDHLPVDGHNQDEVAAFVRGLYVADHRLAVNDVRYDPDTKQASFLIRTHKVIGVKAEQKNADESKALECHAEEYRYHVATVLEAMRHTNAASLTHKIETQLTHEQHYVNQAYQETRIATKTAYQANDHVYVIADKINDNGFPFKFYAALDGAVESGKFGAKATSPSDIRFGSPDDFVHAYKDPDKQSPFIYTDIIKRAFSLQQGQATVTGIVNHFDTTPDRDIVLINGQKRVIQNQLSKQIYADIADINKNRHGPTLTLATDYIAPAEGDIVLSDMHMVAKSKGRSGYYAMRFNDGSLEGKFSEQALFERYQNLDQAPNIDISSPSHHRVLYCNQAMGKTI